MCKKKKMYSNEEQLFLLREYQESGLSKRSFCSRHGISCSHVLNYWSKKYGTEGESLSLHPEPEETEMSNRSKEDYKEENAHIKELEKALEFSRLETLARDMIIDKAEDYFDIPIRKKSGAK